MKPMRRIPYGVMNYEELVRECYFEDNTKCLRELEAVKTPVILLPARPGWDHTVETAVVEVYGNIGYKWFPVEG